MSTSTSDTTTAADGAVRDTASAPETVSAATEQASERATSTQPFTPVKHVRQIAERAFILPFGASLVVREDITSTVKGLAHKYTTRTGLERELKRFEKRGTTARTRLERQMKKRRTKFERELRQRRRRVERAVVQNRKRVQRDLVTVRRDVSKRSDVVTGRVEKLVSNAQGLIGSLH